MGMTQVILIPIHQAGHTWFLALGRFISDLQMEEIMLSWTDLYLEGFRLTVALDLCCKENVLQRSISRDLWILKWIPNGSKDSTSVSDWPGFPTVSSQLLSPEAKSVLWFSGFWRCTTGQLARAMRMKYYDLKWTCAKSHFRNPFVMVMAVKKGHFSNTITCTESMSRTISRGLESYIWVPGKGDLFDCPLWPIKKASDQITWNQDPWKQKIIHMCTLESCIP